MKALYKKILLNTDWKKVDLGKFDDFYIIAQKAKKDSRSDIIKKDDVRKIKFEVGVDSFTKKKPLTINYITLNFNDVSSSDVVTNDLTAIAKVLNYPSVFYIRPIEIIDKNNNVIKEGKTSIKIGINALRLN